MENHIQVKKPKTMAFVLIAGAFVGLFSETALNMALSNIMDEFSISPATVQWLTTGYLLTLGVLVPISALLIKWFSTRKLVIAGLILSIIGTIFAGISTNFQMLLMGRVIQAMGTGIILPLMMNVILLIFPMHRRGIVMGMMGLVITTAPAIGPTLSGFIVTALHWSYIFWISFVFYLLLLIFGVSKIENVSDITKPKIDFISIFLSTIGFGLFIYALSTMAEKSLSSLLVLLPLLTGILALVIFVWRQFKMTEPMMNLSVFKYPMFTLGTVLLFLGMLVILSTGILLPMYLKGALLFSAAMAGLMLLPGNVLNALMSPIVGSLFDKFGAKKFLILGFFLVFVANLSFVLTITATTPIWQVVTAYMILFLGISMIIMPAQTNGLNQLPRNLYADGSAVMNTLQQIAGSIGTVIAITLMVSGQNLFVDKFPESTSEELLAAGTKYTFVFIMTFALIGLFFSLFVKKKQINKYT
ncbi:MDR family MFS transporter [Oceanobacillus neutriphilus]|uniref:Lincomycin resistance protein LmrB n=1 Tax=Oceanobacillus neutriphilus TaxID=531815 RepID=A0ABQ2P0C2_9BACI|nr:MDR family MFS transporter [Oceanobacillus neutriphilus]GGP14919.1 lincomycin resistance protein LmrB [Oceanobacillus neutriphilus]